MVRIKEIQQALAHVVGWQQSYNPVTTIDSSLTESESGLTFQGAHPLVTLENVRSVMPDDFMFQYPEWNMILTYKIGTKVRHNGQIWIANQENTNVEPAPNDFNQDFNNDFGQAAAGAWVLYNILSDFLGNLTIQGINTVIQQFIQIKQLQRETKDLLERRMFFDGAARLTNFQSPSGKIVGFEIVPVRAMGVTTKIDRIGLQMIGGTGIVKMYLFHSSQLAPIKTVELDFTNTNGGFQWFKVDLYLPYIGNETDAGGAWFLCYNQDELPEGMRALNVTRDWSKEPCQTCLGYGLESWKEITKYLQVSPFCVQAKADFAEYPEMWDIGETAFTPTMNHGINCEISVGCDISDFIISQRMIFATVIQRQVVASVLRTIAMNPDVRVNRNQVNVTRDQLLYEIDGNPQGRASGLAKDLKDAYAALSLDTRGLDRICLQCNNHGVKYRTV